MGRGRQPNGQSSIYLGANGNYHTYVHTGRTAPNGRPERKHLERRTATEVATARDELLGRIRAGADVSAKIETAGAWLMYWVDNVVKPRRAYKTWQSYRSLLVNHAVPALGGYRLMGTRNRLEPEHVEGLYARLAGRHKAGGTRQLADSSILKLHEVLSVALADAKRRGKADRNVCDLVETPAGEGREVRALTLAEAQAVIREALADEWAPRWLLGILLGDRQGEALGLRWSGDETVSRLDLDGDPPMRYLVKQQQRHTYEHGCDDPRACCAEHHRTRPCPPKFEHGCGGRCPYRQSMAHFCPQRRQVPGCNSHQRACPPPCAPDCAGHAQHCPQRVGGIVESRLKSKKSVRHAPLPPVLVNLLIAARERQQRQADAGGWKWSPRGLCFTTETGHPLDPRRDYDAWQDLLRRAGVRRSRLHAGRHTAGTLMLATGTDIRVVQETLGHADIRTTTVYTEVAGKLKQEAVDRVAAALFDGSLAALLQPAPVERGSLQ